jgi:hypothetical protein
MLETSQGRSTLTPTPQTSQFCALFSAPTQESDCQCRKQYQSTRRQEVDYSELPIVKE